MGKRESVSVTRSVAGGFVFGSGSRKVSLAIIQKRERGRLYKMTGNALHMSGGPVGYPGLQFQADCPIVASVKLLGKLVVD